MKDASLFSRVFTIAFIVLLCALTAGTFVYLSVAPDFVPPAPPQTEQAAEPEAVDYEALLYEYTMDDLLTYLDGLGYLDKDDIIPMSVIGTDNWIGNGIDLIWWDVDNLVEGTEPHTYWTDFQKNGFILFGGSIYAPMLNGPFAICATANFPGNAEQLYADFEHFAQNYGAAAAPVEIDYEALLYEYTMDDLLTYLDGLGLIDMASKQPLSVIGTENWQCSGVDVIWWDVDNLAEGTEPHTYWNDFQKNGFIFYGTSIYAPVFNGPFAIYPTAYYSGNTDELFAAFENFAQNYVPGGQ